MITREALLKYIINTTNVPDSVLPQNIGTEPKQEPIKSAAEKTAELTGEIKEITAEIFIKIVQAQDIDGNELLEIFGNSKLSKAAYREIEDNPSLNLSRLIEIFEESEMTSDDYKEMLIEINERIKSDSSKEPPIPHSVPTEEKPERKIPDYKSATDFDDADDYVPGINRAKLIICFVLMVLITFASFGLRYYYTGSFLLTDAPVADESITTNEQLFDLISPLSNEAAPAVDSDTSYTKSGRVAEKNTLTKLLSTGDYIIYCTGNKLNVIKTIGGQMTLDKTIEYENTLLGVVEINGRFVAVSQSLDVASPFSYQQNNIVTNEAGEEITETVTLNDTLLKNIVKLDYLNAENPSKIDESYLQTGTLVKLVQRDGGLVVITSDTAAANAVVSVPETYIPYYEIGGTKSFVPVETLFIPSEPMFKSYLVFGKATFADTVTANIPQAVLGGSNQVFFTPDDDNLYIGQNTATDAAILRYSLENGLDAYFFADGAVDASCGIEIKNDILRLTTLKNNAVTLSLYNAANAFIPLVENAEDAESKVVTGEAPIAQMNSIATGKLPLCTYFDENAAYVVALGQTAQPAAEETTAETTADDSDDAELSLYGINTINPDDLFQLEHVEYSLETLSDLGNDKALKLVPQVDENGERTALTLELYATGEATPKLIASYEIKAESTIEGNWSKYLQSPIELDPASLVSSDSKILLPICYFDGVSEIEKFLVFSYDNSTLELAGSIIEYDVRSQNQYMALNGNVFFCVMDNRIKSAKLDDFIAISDFAF